MLYSIKLNNFIGNSIYLSIIIFILFSNNSTNQLPIIYFLYTIIFLFKRKKNLLQLFSPLSLFYLYTSISFSIGAWAFNNDIVLNNENLMAFKYFTNLRYSTCYILLALIIIDNVDLKINFSNLIKEKSQYVYDNYNFNMQQIFVILMVIVILINLNIDLSFLGYSGSLNYFFFSIIILVALIKISKLKTLTRIFCYLFIFVLLSFVLYSSKRELIFFILPIILLEVRNFKRLNIKAITTFIIGSLFIITSIITMSLLRGYGGLITNNNISPIQILKSIPVYISNENFLKYLFNNLEVNYTFYHTYQAFEYIFNDSSLLIWGESIIKPFTLLIPRELFPIKPQSIIHRYTEIYSPIYREQGGSFPINLIAESFFNFHCFGILFLLLISIIISKSLKVIFKFNNKHYFVFFMFAYMNLLMLYRGSGFDLYATYILLFLIFYSIATIPYYVLKKYYSSSK
ncbi:MAG: hypothetical protein CL832_09245 [Crocinitomicaceae bacterium]|nr:hypothetical protein [Crocinitomicaceae bacterium]|tara:strand:- start:2890 stop:4263 length:1374 start_codon:yes stop_codon:yes gene_type:complete